MYRLPEFPRVVYGPDGASMVINEDERPDGYVNDPAGVDTTSAEAKEACCREGGQGGRGEAAGGLQGVS